MKSLILTRHARARAQSRGIPVEWIENTVNNPDWIEPDHNDLAIERRYRAIGQFGGRILRVACIETNDHFRVISVMFDRNARRRS